MTTERVKLGERAGHELLGDLALPASEGRAPAILVVHEWWGLNDDMRRTAERFAAEGFLALAVDLYRGRCTSDANEAMQLSNELSTAEAMLDLGLAVAFLKAHSRSSGKLGITGFCLGGAMALAAACNVAGLSAAVPFYGIARPEFLDFSRCQPPIQAHFGKQDPIIAVERPVALEQKAKEAGASLELHLYDAGHAFMRQSDPGAFHPDSAQLAWQRTLGFLRQHLSA